MGACASKKTARSSSHHSDGMPQAESQVTPPAPPPVNPVASAAIQAGLAQAVKMKPGESAEFLNQIMEALQPYLRVAVAKLIKETVEPMFADMLPAPLKSLHFNKIDLGPEPVRLSNFDVDKYAAEDDAVKLDMDVDWDGELDVEMAVTITMIPFHFGVERLKFSGRVSVLMRPLIEEMPLISALQVSLMNPPDIKLDFTGVANALDIGLIDDSIRGIITSILSGMMVLPNRMIIPLVAASDYYKSYLDPMGFVRVHVLKGEGFKNLKWALDSVPDLYCKVSFGGNKPWQTSIINNNIAPEWKEAHDFLLSDHDQIIKLEVLNSNYGTDSKMGYATITVDQLLSAGGQVTLGLHPHGHNEKASAAEADTNVTISCEIFKFTSSGTSITSPAPDSDKIKEHNGLLTVLLNGAYELAGPREDMQVQAEIECHEEKVLTAMVVDNPGVDVQSPQFNSVLRVLLTPDIVSKKPEVKITLNKSKKGVKGKDALGVFTIPFDDILAGEGNLVDKELAVESGGVVKARLYLLGVEKA